MSTSVNSVVSHFPSAENGFSTTTSSSTSPGAVTVELNSVTGYDNGEVVVFVIEPTSASAKQTFTGVVDVSGVQITDVVWTAGSNQVHNSGSVVVDFATATHISMISKGLVVQHKQDGTHANTITTNTINENTAANGVTVDGLNIKDSKLVTADSVVTANITDRNVTSEKLETTVAFSAYMSALTTMGVGAYTKGAYNTESYDIGEDYDTTLYRFVAPYKGVYAFSAQTTFVSGNERGFIAFYKNGSQVARGHDIDAAGVAGVGIAVAAGYTELQLNATDYVEVFIYTDDGLATGSGDTNTKFAGHLIGRTA